MSEFSWSLIVVGAYRLCVLLSGILSIYCGYKLFRMGVYERAGELKASFGNSHLGLRQAAPGTFFALFGAIVISLGIWKGINIQSSGVVEPSPEPTVPLSSEVPPQTQRTPAGATAINPTVIPTAKPSEKPPQASPISAAPDPIRVESIIQKSVDGKALDPDEQKTLKKWFEDQKLLFPNQFHIEVNRQPSPEDKKETIG